MKGNRKLIENSVNAVILLVGLFFAGKYNLSADVYFAFVAGVIGKAGVFMWGNAREHKYSKDK